MEMGKIVAKLRAEKNLTQKQLAILLNVSGSTISNYENGVHSPDPLMLNKLADFFGVSVDYLLGRTGYRFDLDKWKECMMGEYALTDFANTVMELDEKKRESVMWYALFLKERQS